MSAPGRHWWVLVRPYDSAGRSQAARRRRDQQALERTDLRRRGGEQGTRAFVEKSIAYRCWIYTTSGPPRRQVAGGGRGLSRSCSGHAVRAKARRLLGRLSAAQPAACFRLWFEGGLELTHPQTAGGTPLRAPTYAQCGYPELTGCRSRPCHVACRGGVATDDEDRNHQALAQERPLVGTPCLRSTPSRDTLHPVLQAPGRPAWS